jgi:hypothetical protein
VQVGAAFKNAMLGLGDAYKYAEEVLIGDMGKRDLYLLGIDLSDSKGERLVPPSDLLIPLCEARLLTPHPKVSPANATTWSNQEDTYSTL